MSSQRSERIRCHLPCEIVAGRRRRVPGTVTGLSDKGFSLQTDHPLSQGTGVRVCIMPHRGARAVLVDAIAWSSRERFDRRTGETHRETGFLMSEVTPQFSALLKEVRHRDRPTPRRHAPIRGKSAVEIRSVPASDHALPRPLLPLPPAKPEEEDNLPRFRVRLKQSSGPRSRSAVVRARSEQEAERRAVGDLEGDWEALEVRRLRD